MSKPNSRRAFLSSGLAASAVALQPFSVFAQAVDGACKSSSPSDLKITDVKCGYIRGGHGLFVKIYTNQGIWGCGEGADATPGTYHLVKSFGRRIEGQSPLNPHRLFEQIRKSGFFEGAQSGMFVAVLTAVETALWDLAGRHCQVNEAEAVFALEVARNFSLSASTSGRLPVGKSSLSQESMMDRFELMTSYSEQFLNRAVDVEKSLELWH